MGLEIGEIQRSLAAEGLDGWLLYDFHGSNPIAARMAGLLNGSHMTTRRWYYLIPRSGEPRALVHAIERQRRQPVHGDEHESETVPPALGIVQTAHSRLPRLRVVSPYTYTLSRAVCPWNEVLRVFFT